MKASLESDQVQEFTTKRRLFVKTADQIMFIQEMAFEDHNRLLDEIFAARSTEIKVAFASGWKEQPQANDKQPESFDYSLRFESHNESRRNSVPRRSGSLAQKREEFTYTQTKTSRLESSHRINNRRDSTVMNTSTAGHRQLVDRQNTSRTDEDSILQPLTPQTYNGFSKETERSSLRKASGLQIVRESQSSDLNTDFRPTEPLQADLDAAVAKIGLLTTANTELLDKLGNLRSELEKKQKQISQLEERIELNRRQLTSTHKDADLDYTSDKLIIDRPDSVRESTDSRLGASSRHPDAAALHERQEAVSREIEETSRSIDARTNKMIELKSLLFKLEAEKSSKQRKMADMDKDISDLQLKVAEKEKVIQEVRAAHSMKTSNKQKLVSELTTASASIEKLTASIEQEVIIITNQRKTETAHNPLDESVVNVSESFGRMLEAGAKIKSLTKSVHSAWRQLTGNHEDSDLQEPESVEEEDCNTNSIPLLLKTLDSTLDKMAQVSKNLERTQTKVDTWTLTSDSISQVVDKQQQLSKTNLEKVEKIHHSSKTIEKSLSELRDALAQDLESDHGSVHRLSHVETQLQGFEADLLAFTQNIRRDSSRHASSSRISTDTDRPISMVREVLEWFKTTYSKSQSVDRHNQTLHLSRSELNDIDAQLHEASAEEKKLALQIDSMSKEIDRLRAETHLKLSDLSRLEGKIEYMRSSLAQDTSIKQQLQTHLSHLTREIELYCSVTVGESKSWLPRQQRQDRLERLARHPSTRCSRG